MAKTRGRDQRGPMERLVKIAAYLKLAGEQGAPADKLIEIAGYEGEYAQRLLTSERGHLIKQRWQLRSIGEPGTPARYRMVNVDNSTHTPEQRRRGETGVT